MGLRVMKEMQMARLIVQLLHLLPCGRKKDYGLKIEMKKENLVKGSVETWQEERKSKGRSSLDEIQRL